MAEKMAFLSKSCAFTRLAQARASGSIFTLENSSSTQDFNTPIFVYPHVATTPELGTGSPGQGSGLMGRGHAIMR